MRFITWNLRIGNKKAVYAADIALAKKPDVICFQEVSQSVLHHLRKVPGYSTHASYDFLSRDPRKNGYTVTMLRYPVIDEMEIPYIDTACRSILDRIIYRMLGARIEQHNAIVITYDSPTGPSRVVNMRLSCAMSIRSRLSAFMELITHIPGGMPVIYCGDYNVVDSPLFTKLTGWLRGFTKFDYRINERQEFESLFSYLKCTNIFKGISTSVTKIPILQFDHILVPDTMRVVATEVSVRRYGSDHRMLVADIE